MSAAILLPMLCLFLCAAVDLGRYCLLGSELQAAANAVARAIQDEGGPLPEAEARNRLLASSPSLAADGLTVWIAQSSGPISRHPYTHHLFGQDEGGFQGFPAETTSWEVEVSTGVTGSFLTPVGAAVAAAQGRDGSSFELRACAVGVVDKTMEEGLWR